MLELRLFGTPELRYNGQVLRGFPGQQPYLLLCYLVLGRKHSHRREHVASIFWGDYTTDISRKYLRNALWRLRQALEDVGVPVVDYLSISGEHISFLTTGRYWLDLEQFEHTLARYQGQPAESLTTEDVADIERALDLVVGELLEGIYEDWCIVERERFSSLYLAALEGLMAYFGLERAYGQALACGERILACNRGCEHIYREMMKYYWLAGRRSDALAHYKLCRQVLRDELDVEPMPETRHWYEQMRQNCFDCSRESDAGTQRNEYPDRNDVLQLTLRQALRRLEQLQTIVEQADIEMRQLGQLIRQATSHP